MTRGRRNRGRRNRNGPGYAGDADADAAMTGQDSNPGRRLPKPQYPAGAPRGPRHEDRPARRRPPNNYSQPYAEDVTKFDVVPSAAAEPCRPDSPEDDAGAAAAAAFLDGLFHPAAGAGHGGAPPRHAGGGVPNRRCAECRSVRKTNLRLRDHVLRCLERARRLLVAWSAEVGVPLDLAADDEMDWQPEPLIRVLLLAPADAAADAHPPPPPHPLGGSPCLAAQQHVAGYVGARTRHLRPPHPPPAPPDRPPGQPRLQPHPPPPLPPDQPHQQPPAYASFHLPAHPPQQAPPGGVADAPAPAATTSTMATTVEEYDEPGQSPFAAAAAAPSVASTDTDAD